MTRPRVLAVKPTRIWTLTLLTALPILIPSSAGTALPRRLAAAGDAVITYRRPPPTFGAAPEETWYKHGDAVRIDSRQIKAPGLVFQRFTQPGQRVDFRLTRSADGQWRSASLMDDAVAALPKMSARAFSGAIEKHLGERCRVWQVTHKIPNGIDFVQSGCVTAKGIELWWRQANIGTIIATRISYQPVSVDAVRVPVRALDIRAWTSINAPGDHRRDYQVSLRGPDPHGGSFLRTRSGPWEATATSGASGSTDFSLINIAVGLRTEVSIDREGNRRFGISRYQSREPLSRNYVRLASLPNQKVLGETCRWWNAMPGVMDAGRTECLTADGIPLVIVYTSMASSSSIKAERLERSRQPLSAVMPDRRVQDPTFWRFEGPR